MRNTFVTFVSILCLFLSTITLHAQSSKGFTWQAKHSVNFGIGANHFTIKAASNGWGGELALRLDAADGQIIGRVYFNHTGISSTYPDSSAHFLDYDCKLSSTISGTHDVYMDFQDYSEPIIGGVLRVGSFAFDLLASTPVTRDSLHVYPPVPGLSPSPYYEYRVQKVSKLNSSDLANVTNWETPFAWFTHSPLQNTDPGYHYAGYIGGWSHTYTNFELDANTPIVVKITRKTVTGDDAPAGPIKSAAVHPAHKVDSLKLINGEVYVYMKNPVLVTVDIDGQLDSRNAPRVKDGWGSDAFPYTNRKDGCHAVSIFANPFINDKPNPNAPGVLVIKAGTLIPSDINTRNWTTLYFEPGVHKLSAKLVDGKLVERRWEPKDIITINANKTIYIPGDAIVYGNFSNKNKTTANSDNFRIYGHGTVSGSKILFWKAWTDYPNSEYPDSWSLRSIVVDGAKNVRFEGITIADPSNHSFSLTSSLNTVFTPNVIRWAKVIAWRPNTDATAITGHTILEDCFFRTQDDGHYTGGAVTMRRVVFWHDVNGATFRGDAITRRFGADNAANVPKEILIEDIDIIYARGVFGFYHTPGFAIIQGEAKDNKILKDGVENTGQMVHFRNINVEDPKPVRHMFGLTPSEEAKGDLAGIRFENITYKAKQTFGWKGGIMGNAIAKYRNFVFDNVSINGKKFGANNITIPSDIATNQYQYDMTYRLNYKIPSTKYTLVTTSTNGLIVIDTINTTPGKAIVKAVPLKGYKFLGWSGDLATTDSIAPITMDRDKGITANFKLITYTITKSATNGSIVFEPALDKFLPGTVVTIKAVGNLGWGLDSWGGDLSGTENPKTIIMNGDKSVSATFKVVPTYKVVANSENGSVILNPAGGVYSQGVELTLTAKPTFGYKFSDWTGDLLGTDNPRKVIVNADMNIRANFTTIKGEVMAFAVNCGGASYTASDGAVYQADNRYSGGGTYSTGSLIADTEDDILYQSERFGNFSYNINLPNGEYKVVLMYAEIYSGASGERVFNVSIEGAGVTSKLDLFSKVGKNKRYEEIHYVTLQDGVLNIAFETIAGNAKISSIKVLIPGPRFELLTNSTNGSIIGNPSGAIYDSTTVVSLTAIPNVGYVFSGWSGSLSGSKNPESITMNSDKSVNALFTISTDVNGYKNSDAVNLFQNYPNPFSNKTTISYQVQNASTVVLSIYNILGKRITTLVNEYQTPGKYSVDWNLENNDGTLYKNGVYTIKLEVGKNSVQTIKTVLLK